MDRPSPLSSSATARGGGGGGREDCWSEEATEALIEAWGGRYAQLNRGILRQKDWSEVAEAVNARRDGGKPPKTDAQCKNRIDTLKKKYKLEKSKPVPSKWPFFSRLDSLVGGANPAAKKPTTLTFTLKSAKSRSNPVPVGFSGSESSESSIDGVDDDDEVGFDRREVVKKHRSEIVGSSDGSACRELARAILKFGEVYQRTEISKQQQVMELERQRMEFTRDLELQRMNMFMDTQLELEKVKSQKSAPGSGKKV